MAIARQRGTGLALLMAVLTFAFVSAGALALSSASTEQHRQRATERALAQAREALLAYAADRPIDARVGPGYLPCPDLDDDGWAEATCGSLAGNVGQDQRLARLPWKTLGLPDLRDGHGERLWYAVSTRFKGLLNCAASRACIDMTPPQAIGTITVRDPTGRAVHDGTHADPGAMSGGAAAVVLSPGPPLTRRDGHEQRRDCSPQECDTRGRCLAEPPSRTARCDPRNYLDAAAGEDNARFHDRSDAARALNTDGFIDGPVLAEARLEVNDRLVAIAQGDITARVMARVALELTHCVRLGEVPASAPDAACPASPALGRVADAWLTAPTCNAALDDPGWWRAWRPHVLYARAAPAGMQVVDAQGIVLGERRRFAIAVTREPGSCAAGRFECDASGCSRALQPPRRVAGHDALAASP